MITEINESKTLTKHILCKCKCRLDGRKCNLNPKLNNDKCRYECKKSKFHHVFEKKYIWNPATCSYENDKYLASVIDDSVITCDKVIDRTKTVQQVLIKKMQPAKQKISIIYLPFY